MTVKRSIPILLAAALATAPLHGLSSPASAQEGASAAATSAATDDARRAQIVTATVNAGQRLREQVGGAAIMPDLTVNQFLARTGAEQAFTTRLRGAARQIGGPRWIDEAVCQIQLEVSGRAVADMLLEISRSDPRASPVAPEVLARELKGWTQRSFSASGSSISPMGVRVIRPVRARAWEHVGDDVREQAVSAARQDAVRRALDSIKPIELAPGTTVADALSRAPVGQRMNRWFESRPVKSISFTESLQVDLTLGAAADDAFEELMSAVREGDAGLPLPQDERALAELRQKFVSQMTEPTGRASVSRTAVEPLEPRELELPPQPPAWALREVPLDAEGTAAGDRRAPLIVQRAAQQAALDNLRATIGALPLRDDLTVAQAAHRDPAVAAAIDRAMLRAQVYKVDIRSDGGRIVRVTLDPRHVWEELFSAR